jgi:hypothetical protein
MLSSGCKYLNLATLDINPTVHSLSPTSGFHFSTFSQIPRRNLDHVTTHRPTRPPLIHSLKISYDTLPSFNHSHIILHKIPFWIIDTHIVVVVQSTLSSSLHYGFSIPGVESPYCHDWRHHLHAFLTRRIGAVHRFLAAGYGA